MLENIVEKGLYSFHHQFESWEDAIKAACRPLEEKGIISTDYSQYIINNVHEFGPYIVIAPEICIPHAQEGKGVYQTEIGFMKTEVPVDFGPNCDYTARLFFVLASINNDQHLENLTQLVTLLEDESLVKKLLSAQNAEDLLSLTRK
ncbi:PTS sugar transporter subunit IIA [Globicatella sulfidifaciens]|uniref:Ascorbate-specific PTS system EIIA component n=1 Tax=Globicatella sulfidifaciens DSM 15739 TaxID=1121925 RepID=A0A1T4LU27_9LACT|nr:PTS sugar transporter subunit IIA [Globicatella sulfidifaciens]SJZ58038.1 PTS system IIA component, L-Asc family [Globicatella sulfidifaciens DSM 15739]